MGALSFIRAAPAGSQRNQSSSHCRTSGKMLGKRSGSFQKRLCRFQRVEARPYRGARSARRQLVRRESQWQKLSPLAAGFTALATAVFNSTASNPQSITCCRRAKQAMGPRRSPAARRECARMHAAQRRCSAHGPDRWARPRHSHFATARKVVFRTQGLRWM